MKKYVNMHSYLIKPIINKISSRLLVGLLFSLIWNHFSNQYKLFGIIQSIFFLVGIFLLTMGWFNYLNLDGVKIGKLKRNNKKKRISGYHTSSIIDYLEEEVNDENLEDDDELLASMVANILAAISFLLPALICTYL